MDHTRDMPQLYGVKWRQLRTIAVVPHNLAQSKTLKLALYMDNSHTVFGRNAAHVTNRMTIFTDSNADYSIRRSATQAQQHGYES